MLAVVVTGVVGVLAALLLVVRTIAIVRCFRVHPPHALVRSGSESASAERPQQQRQKNEFGKPQSNSTLVTGQVAGSGVSILKPLKGADLHLRSNLETFVRQAVQQANVEVLFCLETADDPAAQVVEDLLNEYPTARARCFTLPRRRGVNPKINNLYEAFESATYDTIWISDANLRTSDAHFTLTLTEFASVGQHGVLHQPPLTVYRNGFAAAIEEAYFSTQHCYLYAFADAMRINGFNGMSILLSRQLFKTRCGDLTAFSDFLAEDFFMSQALYAAGCRHRMSNAPAMQNAAPRQPYQLFLRLVRWQRLRQGSMWAASYLELLAEAWTSCVLLTLVVSPWAGLLFWLVAQAQDMLLQHHLTNLFERPPTAIAQQIVANWTREVHYLATANKAYLSEMTLFTLPAVAARCNSVYGCAL
ncbi:uncharacterized protein MONBRDRAFT_33437 [Monosiga brevicollis MX1]|uniref:ceramide glucosyltransferase n=1 Tax=Monosiga brevicollis TaxID=81824 RepID=A9V5E4_MONBE|nr:uncharacterized protein MONBRDRAFT_33437 [Monosiga brevicollis MX1]EDQ87357.1 predicted protein [Monosiga brevicollis MX1]|eukprot:XP_001747970.1 hypothetical protein [Monosiga brevicollis MX1]